MREEISLFQRFGLATGSQYNYSEVANAFIGTGYTSQAGNTYFNALRIADGIIVKEDVGQGYAHTFLNGLRIFDIKTKSLLCERYYNCNFYSKSNVESEVIDMLYELIVKAAEKDRIRISEYEVRSKIKMIVCKSFEMDQRVMLTNQSQKYLM